MPSPICLIDSTATNNGFNTTPSATVIISLRDKTGVTDWDISCISTDDTLVAADVNLNDLTIDDLTKTASLNVSDHTRGAAYIFQSKINNGIDTNGNVQENYTTTFSIYSIGTNTYRLIPVNQTVEGNATFGWVEDLNNLLSDEYTDFNGDYDFGSNSVETTGHLACETLETDIGGGGNTILGAEYYNTFFISDIVTFIIPDGYEYSTYIVDDLDDITLPAASPSFNGRLITISNQRFSACRIYGNFSGSRTHLNLGACEGATIISYGTKWYPAHSIVP